LGAAVKSRCALPIFFRISTTMSRRRRSRRAGGALEVHVRSRRLCACARLVATTGRESHRSEMASEAVCLGAHRPAPTAGIRFRTSSTLSSTRTLKTLTRSLDIDGNADAAPSLTLHLEPRASSDPIRGARGRRPHQRLHCAGPAGVPVIGLPGRRAPQRGCESPSSPVCAAGGGRLRGRCIGPPAGAASSGISEDSRRAPCGPTAARAPVLGFWHARYGTFPSSASLSGDFFSRVVFGRRARFRGYHGWQ